MVILLSYKTEPSPRWWIDGKNLGAESESWHRALHYLKKKGVAPDKVKFEFEGGKPQRADLEGMFRESYRSLV